jgi:uncharacterized membrane protein YidH (DUF202 family)
MAEVASADRGLQPQRTALAWSRTGLAVFVNALIVLRAGLMTEQTLILALGVFLLVAAGLLVVGGTWRMRDLATHGGRSGPPFLLITTTVCVSWVACLAGVASIIVTHP